MEKGEKGWDWCMPQLACPGQRERESEKELKGPAVVVLEMSSRYTTIVHHCVGKSRRLVDLTCRQVLWHQGDTMTPRRDALMWGEEFEGSENSEDSERVRLPGRKDFRWTSNSSNTPGCLIGRASQFRDPILVAFYHMLILNLFKHFYQLAPFVIIWTYSLLWHSKFCQNQDLRL